MQLRSHLRWPIGDIYLSAQKLVFCNSDLDKSTTSMRTLMIYLCLTGVHFMGLYLINMHLIAHFMGVLIIGVYFMAVHLMAVHLMAVYLIGVNLMACASWCAPHECMPHKCASHRRACNGYVTTMRSCTDWFCKVSGSRP